MTERYYVRWIDRLIYFGGLLAMLAALLAQCQAQELPEETFSERLNRATQAEVQKIHSRVDAVELKLKSLEQRVTGLEQSDISPSVSAGNASPATATNAPQQAVPTTTNVRWSQSELNTWVRQRYTRHSPLRWTVAQGYSVYTHLREGKHGFSEPQVNGLEPWVAYALHDAHHQGLIQPWRTRTSSTVVISAPTSAENVSPVATVQRSVTVQRTYATGCANGRCARRYAQSLSIRRGPIRRLFNW